MSTFSHAGVSKQDGEFKVRFANDSLRVKVLAKNGHTDIDIVELKHPMTKLEAVAYLLSIDFDNGNKAVRAALEQGLDKRSDTPKVAKAPKAKVAVKKGPTMDAIKAKVTAKKTAVSKAEVATQLADMEDAPY
jgi:hypothetical protein